MDHLPIFLDIRGRKVLVDGGGTAAARRAERALDCGALVTVCDPAPGPDLSALAGHAALTSPGGPPAGLSEMVTMA